MSKGEVKANLMLPTVAASIDDIGSRWGMLDEARKNGLPTGLMLIQKPGKLDVVSRDEQIKNLKEVLGNGAKFDLVIHHPNMPVDSYNWLTHPDEAMGSVKQSVELAKRLKRKFELEEIKVSFHLNSLMLPGQWEELQEKEEGMWEQLKELVEFAKDQEVRLVVETTPVPEFGDVERNEKSKIILEGVEEEVYLADLVNPFPLLPWRGNIQKLRNMGFSLVIDFCHTDIAIRAIAEIDDLPEEKQELVKQRYLVSEEDVKKAQEYVDKGFKNVVEEMTKDGDIWNANNGRGLYKEKEIYDTTEYFEEGVALSEGEGDISIEQLAPLMLAGLQMAIDIVLDINETNFKDSPNTVQSLKWFLSLLESVS